MRETTRELLATILQRPLVDHDRIDASHRAYAAQPETRKLLAMFVRETGCEPVDAALLVEIAFRAGMSEGLDG